MFFLLCYIAISKNSKRNNTPLERQVREGVEIVRAEADVVLNSRLDYFQPGIRRVTFGDVYDDLES